MGAGRPRLLIDGGLSANIPVAVARAAGADRVIVVDATEHPSDSVPGYSPLIVADRLVQFLFQQPSDSLGPGDLLVRPEVEGFTNLNFSPRSIERLCGCKAPAPLSGSPSPGCSASMPGR